VKLSILIAALTSRQTMLDQLLSDLASQAAPFGEEVEILVEQDAGQMASGEKRNRLIRRSQGRYFAFVDDDDTVSAEYVKTLVEATDLDRHVISFDLERLAPGRPREVHSFSIWHKDRQRLDKRLIGMRANHLCAWRRDIGTLISFPSILGYNDDVFWYDPLLASGRVKTEHHVDAVLYRYKYSPGKSRNQLAHQLILTREWSNGGVPCWDLDGRLFVAVMGQAHYDGLDYVQARDGNGTVYTFGRDGLPTPYFIARMK